MEFRQSSVWKRVVVYPRSVRYGGRAGAVRGRIVVQRDASVTPELKPAQRRALLTLESEPGASLTRSEYERLTGVGRSQAAADLSELVTAGLLVRAGGGRSTRYVHAHEPATKRRWTPDRIRRELETFCADRSTWPTAREFKAAGRSDLYIAASRYGGVAHWANEVGLERLDRSRPTSNAVRAPLRVRLGWAFAGALAALALAAAIAAAVVATQNVGSNQTGGRALTKPTPASLIGEGWLNPLRHSATPASSEKAPPRASKRDPSLAEGSARRAPATHSREATTSTPRQATMFVANALPKTSTRQAPAAGKTFASTGLSSNGPTPLQAPTGASAPSPLRAP